MTVLIRYSIYFLNQLLLKRETYRRKKKTAEKAKVFTAVWGTELNQFLAALAIFHQVDLKKRLIATYLAE